MGLFFLVIALAVLLADVSAVLNARAWKSNFDYPTAADYPETELLKSKPNTALAFSGGGSRAYIATMGYLAGIRDLDLLKNVRYIGGISGGGWATTTFTFVQNVTDDNVFLGKVVDPQDITEDGLKVMDPACARSLPYKDVTVMMLQAMKDGMSAAEAWSYTISQTYLEPVGIKRGLRFSWDANTVADIKSRNPELANEEFTIPVNANRPFPVIGTALVGPYDGAPFIPSTQNFSMIEITPLYVGTMKNLDVDFKYKGFGKVHTKHVGGAVEPFAFARTGGGAPSRGLPSKATTGILEVPEPENAIDLQFAAGTVSYAPGALMESILVPEVAQALSMQFNYWSPDEEVKPDFTHMMFGDGGSYQDVPLINFMQRGVPKIMSFYDTSTPLEPFEDWDVNTDAPSLDQITNDLSCFFGVLTANDPRWMNRSFEMERNQVFATSDYSRVVTALQTAQQVGTGIFATFNLTTVENTWWGIPAGKTFEITFAYLGRLKQWESLLSPEMQALVVPQENADDLSVIIDHGPFRHFPNYATLGGMSNAERSNLLADMVGWSVKQNADLFRHMLS